MFPTFGTKQLVKKPVFCCQKSTVYGSIILLSPEHLLAKRLPVRKWVAIMPVLADSEGAGLCQSQQQQKKPEPAFLNV
jgi:hypothetical protein